MAPEDGDSAAYRAGRAHAGALLREGLHPDAVRFRLLSAEEVSGRPFGPELWRGVEDAPGGRLRPRGPAPYRR